MEFQPSNWPPEFICPISRSVMADPVIVSSGETYERRCIEAWMDLGQSWCVKLNTPLDRNLIIPNSGLKALITNMSKSKGMHSLPTPPSQGLAIALARRLMRELEQGNTHVHEARDNDPKGKSAEDENEPSQYQKEVEDAHLQLHGLNIADGRRGNHTKSSSSLYPVDAHQRRFTRRAADPEHRPSEGSDRFRSVSELSRESPIDGHGRSTRTDGYATNPVRSSTAGESLLQARQESCELPPHLATKPFSYSSSEVPHMPQSSMASAHDSDLMVQKLQDKQEEEQEAAVTELRHLTRSAENRRSLCCAEILQSLLPLLKSKNEGVQVNAVAALVNLSLEKENRVAIVRAGTVRFLVDVLNNGIPEAQEHAAAAAFSLALADENKHPMGVLNVIPALVHLLRSGPVESRQDAAMALYHLSLVQANKTKLVKVGAVPTLLNLAQSKERLDMASRALIILSNVASIPEGRAALLQLNAITILVKLLAIQPGRNAAAVSEHAATVLVLLAKGNIRFKSIAQNAGAQELLTNLAENGTTRAREKAHALLAIMKESSSGPDELDAESILSRQYLRRRVEEGQVNSSAF